MDASPIPVCNYQNQASETSDDLVGPPPSLASTASVVAPLGETCLPYPTTSSTQLAPNLTSENTHRQLRVLETYGGISLGNVIVAQPPPFSGVVAVS